MIRCHTNWIIISSRLHHFAPEFAAFEWHTNDLFEIDTVHCEAALNSKIEKNHDEKSEMANSFIFSIV